MAEAAAIAARRRYRRSQSEPRPGFLEDDWADLDLDDAWDPGEDARLSGRINRAATAQSRWASWGVGVLSRCEGVCYAGVGTARE